MKTRILLSAVTLAISSLSIFAAEKADSVIVINDADRLTIIEDAEGVSINATNPDGIADSTFTYRSEFAKGAAVSTHQSSSNWSLSSPFKHCEDEVRPKGSIDIETGGFGFGNVIPVGSSLDFKAGLEIMWTHIVALNYKISPYNYLRIGVGIDWKNYKLDESLKFIKTEQGGIAVGKYDDNNWDRMSRIMVFSLVVPVTYSRYLGSDFFCSAGMELNLNTYASMKTKYKVGDDQMKYFDKDIQHSPITFDFIASVSWRHLGLYAKYSPCNVLNTDLGPKFKSFSTGLMFFF